METESGTDATDGTAGGTATDGGGSGTRGSDDGGTDGRGSEGDTDGGGSGTTDDDGTICASIYAPVCGKDGETYDNACVARAAGVEIKRDGPCVGDCEGSCVVAPQGASLVTLTLLVLAVIRPRRRRGAW